MPLPAGISFGLTSANPGVDGNRITVNIVFAFGSSGTSVFVDVYDFNRVVITIDEGFDNVVGTNDAWDVIAAAVNVAAGAYVTAEGASGDHSVVISPDQGLLNGSQGAGIGQFYSAGAIALFNYVSAGGPLAGTGNYATP